MPCRYYTEAEEHEMALAKLNTLTQLLCIACKLLVKVGAEAKMGPRLTTWWREHKEHDKRRIRRDTSQRG